MHEVGRLTHWKTSGVLLLTLTLTLKQRKNGTVVLVGFRHHGRAESRVTFSPREAAARPRPLGRGLDSVEGFRCARHLRGDLV